MITPHTTIVPMFYGDRVIHGGDLKGALTLKKPGLFTPSHSRTAGGGGGGEFHPPPPSDLGQKIM